MGIPAYFYQDCQVCGRSMRIRVEWIGQQVRCGHCGGLAVAEDEARQTAVEANSPKIEQGQGAQTAATMMS